VQREWRERENESPGDQNQELDGLSARPSGIVEDRHCASGFLYGIRPVLAMLIVHGYLRRYAFFDSDRKVRDSCVGGFVGVLLVHCFGSMVKVDSKTL